MERKEYNGWTNYETWAVNLWLTNEQGTGQFWRDRAKNAMRVACRDRASKPHFTTSEHARFALADELKEYHEDGAGEALKNQNTVYTDLLGAALSEVNWAEIANAFLEDCETPDGQKYVGMEVQS